jgi:hypothetical protein
MNPDLNTGYSRWTPTTGLAPLRVTNTQASNVSTIGRSFDDPFVKLLGNKWEGDTIHHVSSTDQHAGGDHVGYRHLIHTLDPKGAAEQLQAHLGPTHNARIIPHESSGGINHDLLVDHGGKTHIVTFFRGRTPTPEGNKVVLKGHPIVVTSTEPKELVLKAEFDSPLYNDLTNSYFGSSTGTGSAWLHPDGSHEVVRNHSTPGMTQTEYQHRTGKVRVGLDRRGAYVGIVGHMTPEQHRVANEFLRAAMFRDRTPSWERVHIDQPGYFEYKESTIPARLVQKALDDDSVDVLKASAIPQEYRMPKMAKGVKTKDYEGSKEHSDYLKTLSFGPDAPHPGASPTPFAYQDLLNAYKAIPGLEEKFGYAPQNLWHSDDALLDMMRKGYGGKNWYQDYHDGLTRLAERTGISPKKLLSIFALNGQAAGLKENAQSTIKEFSRHLAGLYDNPHEAELAKELGIMKAPSGKPAELSTTLDLMGGADIGSKKLKAYAHSFHDPESNPAVDMWIQRAMVGGGNGKEDSNEDSVKTHINHAATGRINYLRDKWNQMNPHDPVTASQVQAMLWYGMKHSAADHLTRVADHIDAHHPEYNTGKIRETAKKIKYDGSFDQTGTELGLNDPHGLPLSSTHLLMRQMTPGLKELYNKGLVHTDHFNWHRVTSDQPVENLAEAITYLQGHHSKYTSVKVKADDKGWLMQLPKRSLDGISELLGHKGVTIDPVKEKEGRSITTLDASGLKEHFAQNPDLHHQLGMLHSTIKRYEDHPHKTLIGDVGHGTAELAKFAHKLFPKGQAPEPMHTPVLYGQFANHPDYQ